MKTPTLKSIEKKYINAKEVRCLATNKVVEIDKKESIFFEMNAYCGKGKNNYGSICLIDLDNSKGYAEIISYIEPTTKVRNSVLLQLAENNSFSEEIIRKECPKLFESEKLEYNRWYKFKSGTLGFFQGIGIKSYGFHFDGNEWINDNFWFSDANLKRDNISLATPQEVETALVNEAKKRGFVEGVTIKNHQGTFVLNNLNFVLSDGKYNDGIWTRQGQGIWLCFNGKWAEIIETPTDIITIVEKYGKDELQKYLDNYKNQGYV